MSRLPPFEISPGAEERLKRAAQIPGMQPGISRALRYTITNEGELTEEYAGEHYSVVFNTPDVWESRYPGAVCVEIAGRAFWLTEETAQTLQGRMLEFMEKEVGRGKCAGRWRGILVANAQPVIGNR